MGEAKRRNAAYQHAKQAILHNSTGDARLVAEAAIQLFENYIAPLRYSNGCYLTTMVLHRYLLDERGIETDPIVGYVNDGTDDIFISHSWLEYEGRKTDITLHIVDPMLPAKSGALLVMGQILKPGELDYSYHAGLTPAALAANLQMSRDPHLKALLAHKEVEHRQMAARAADDNLMKQFVAMAPPQFSYEAMRRALP